MLIFDAHLDLSMNALEWNRDLTRPRGRDPPREAGKTDKLDRGNGTVSLPRDAREARSASASPRRSPATSNPDNPLPGWHSPEIAWAQTQGQLAWYRAMEEAGEMVQIVDRAGPRPPRRARGRTIRRPMRRSATS